MISSHLTHFICWFRLALAKGGHCLLQLDTNTLLLKDLAMNEGAQPEIDQPAKDISDEVLSIIDGPPIESGKFAAVNEFVDSLLHEPKLSVTLPWRSPEWAHWAKTFVSDPDALAAGQTRGATIRCTESQKHKAANVFASGVQWINSEV